MTTKAFGGSPFLRRAAVDLGVLPADVQWTDELTAKVIRESVAIGKPRFDRRLGIAGVPAVTAVPVSHRRSELGSRETYAEFLARVERFERYALTAVELEQAVERAWEDPLATEIVSRHPAAIA